MCITVLILIVSCLDPIFVKSCISYDNSNLNYSLFWRWLQWPSAMTLIVFYLVLQFLQCFYNVVHINTMSMCIISKYQEHFLWWCITSSVPKLYENNLLSCIMKSGKLDQLRFVKLTKNSYRELHCLKCDANSKYSSLLKSTCSQYSSWWTDVTHVVNDIRMYCQTFHKRKTLSCTETEMIQVKTMFWQQPLTITTTDS